MFFPHSHTYKNVKLLCDHYHSASDRRVTESVCGSGVVVPVNRTISPMPDSSNVYVVAACQDWRGTICGCVYVCVCEWVNERECVRVCAYVCEHMCCCAINYAIVLLSVLERLVRRQMMRLLFWSGVSALPQPWITPKTKCIIFRTRVISILRQGNWFHQLVLRKVAKGAKSSYAKAK